MLRDDARYEPAANLNGNVVIDRLALDILLSDFGWPVRWLPNSEEA